MTWREAYRRIMLNWKTAIWMKDVYLPEMGKPRYQVLTWKEYCANGMSHERR